MTSGRGTKKSRTKEQFKNLRTEKEQKKSYYCATINQGDTKKLNTDYTSSQIPNSPKSSKCCYRTKREEIGDDATAIVTLRQHIKN